MKPLWCNGIYPLLLALITTRGVQNVHVFWQYFSVVMSKGTVPRHVSLLGPANLIGRPTREGRGSGVTLASTLREHRALPTHSCRHDP